jgi:hypothetical protein
VRTSTTTIDLISQGVCAATSWQTLHRGTISPKEKINAFGFINVLPEGVRSLVAVGLSDCRIVGLCRISACPAFTKAVESYPQNSLSTALYTIRDI